MRINFKKKLDTELHIKFDHSSFIRAPEGLTGEKKENALGRSRADRNATFPSMRALHKFYWC